MGKTEIEEGRIEMDSPAEGRKNEVRIPPEIRKNAIKYVVKLSIIYCLVVGFLVAIRYAGWSEYFFERKLGGEMTIAIIILGPIYIASSAIYYLHPEKVDWSKYDPSGH
jgi:hypothetical protein